MLTCRQVTELVTDYLEGRMSLLQRVSFHLHLGMCDRCRAYLRQMRLTIKALGKLPDEPIPEDVRDELMARFRGMRPVNWPPPARAGSVLAGLERLTGGARGLAVVVIVLLVAVVGGVVGAGQPGLVFGHCWQACVGMELGAAMLPMLAVGVVAVRLRERVSAGALAALASGGALAGYAVLARSCPNSQAAGHVLVVHVGTIVVAAAIGAAAARLSAFARP